VPEQTEGLLPKAIVGVVLIVTVKASPLLLQPVAEFFTVSVPLYVPAAAPPGTVSPIGLAGSAVNPTFANPTASAAALYVMLYWLGDPVVPV
jgi:hypothetical protein